MIFLNSNTPNLQEDATHSMSSLPTSDRGDESSKERKKARFDFIRTSSRRKYEDMKKRLLAKIADR
jgi:hypothetical protein